MRKSNILLLTLLAVTIGVVTFVLKSSPATKPSGQVLDTSTTQATTQSEKDTLPETASTVKKDMPSTSSGIQDIGQTDQDILHKGTGYITLTEYNSDPSKYSLSKKVYFFHASWCPICQSVDKEIVADPSRIPTDTVIIKTDYDSNTPLRQQYGVTYQYTFVQFDSSGGLLKKWSATSYDKVLAGIM